ncbi:SHOCT domain-containing protein [Rhodocaloribacter litoris]|uniref:SHOCT domain-containing protein n=1 Tax=Rhodocaloribacter litoris TaxID=2558931 RepID=UPI001422939D|nr:SHOCT domain-containing protein [Rhodocaloribacter litoris]QXD14322.1 SHOCT domain-containing protein [Rhodocaloribacter litoris]
MYDTHEWIGGMHWGWWVFLIACTLILVYLFSRWSSPEARGRRETSPMEILRRRYATGEISSEDYAERKAHLERDLS